MVYPAVPIINGERTLRHFPTTALLLILLATLPTTDVVAQATQAIDTPADVRIGDIAISQPWARATAGQTPTGGAYITLRNTGGAADRLIGATTPAAKQAELHIHQMDGAVMRMRAIDAIELPPGASVSMGPGGLHIMLLALKSPLKEGDRLPLTLRFEKAGEVAIEAQILGVGATGPLDKRAAAQGHGHRP